MKNIDPAKLELIRMASERTSGKSGRELAPVMLALITSANKQRKMFRDDMASYRAKAEAVRMAEVYRKEFAIAQCPSDIDSPTVLGAQAANELLDISGIKASFVLTVYDGKIYLSARSIDEVNVQIIAEKLGGGGHINSAGAQFDHTNMDEAIKALKATIDQMIEEGDI